MKFLSHYYRGGALELRYGRMVGIGAENADSVATQLVQDISGNGTESISQKVDKFEKLSPDATKGDLNEQGKKQDEMKNALLKKINDAYKKSDKYKNNSKLTPIRVDLDNLKYRVEKAEEKFDTLLENVKAEAEAAKKRSVDRAVGAEGAESVDVKFNKFNTDLAAIFTKYGIKASIWNALYENPEDKLRIVNNSETILNNFDTAFQNINKKFRNFICSTILLSNKNEANLDGPTARSGLYLNGTSEQIKQGLLDSIYFWTEKAPNGPVYSNTNSLKSEIANKNIIHSPDGYAPANGKKWLNPDDNTNYQVENIASVQNAPNPAEIAESNEATQYAKIASIMTRLQWIQDRDSTTELTNELLDEFEKSTKEAKELIATYKEKNASSLSSNSDKTAKIEQFEKKIGNYESGFSLRRENVKARMAREEKEMNLTKRASTEIPVAIEKGQESRWSDIAADVQKLIKAGFGGKKFSITCNRYALSVADDTGKEIGKLKYQESNTKYAVTLKSKTDVNMDSLDKIFAVPLFLLQLNATVHSYDQSKIDSEVKQIVAKAENDDRQRIANEKKEAEYLKKTYEIPQKEAIAAETAGNYSVAAEKYMAAAEAAEAAGNLDFNKACIFNAARQHFMAKNYPRAITCYKDVTSKRRDDSDKTQFNKAKLYLGFSYFLQNNIEEAKKILLDSEFIKVALPSENDDTKKSYKEAIYPKLAGKPYPPDATSPPPASRDDMTTSIAEQAAKARVVVEAAKAAKEEAARIAEYQKSQAAIEAAKPQDQKIFEELTKESDAKGKILSVNDALFIAENFDKKNIIRVLNSQSADEKIDTVALSDKTPGRDRNYERIHEELFIRAIIRFQIQQKMPNPDGILTKEQLVALMGEPAEPPKAVAPAVAPAPKPAPAPEPAVAPDTEMVKNWETPDNRNILSGMLTNLSSKIKVDFGAGAPALSDAERPEYKKLLDARSTALKTAGKQFVKNKNTKLDSVISVELVGMGVQEFLKTPKGNSLNILSDRVETALKATAKEMVAKAAPAPKPNSPAAPESRPSSEKNLAKDFAEKAPILAQEIQKALDGESDKPGLSARVAAFLAADPKGNPEEVKKSLDIRGALLKEISDLDNKIVDLNYTHETTEAPPGSLLAKMWKTLGDLNKKIMDTPKAAEPAPLEALSDADVKKFESFQNSLSSVLKLNKIGKYFSSSLAPSDLKDKNLDAAVKNLTDALSEIKSGRKSLLQIMPPTLSAKNEDYSSSAIGDTFSLNVFATKDEMVRHINAQILNFISTGSPENKGGEISEAQTAAAGEYPQTFKNARKAFIDGDITISNGVISPKEGNHFVSTSIDGFNFATAKPMVAPASAQAEKNENNIPELSLTLKDIPQDSPENFNKTIVDNIQSAQKGLVDYLTTYRKTALKNHSMAGQKMNPGYEEGLSAQVDAFIANITKDAASMIDTVKQNSSKTINEQKKILSRADCPFAHTMAENKGAMQSFIPFKLESAYTAIDQKIMKPLNIVFLSVPTPAAEDAPAAVEKVDTAAVAPKGTTLPAAEVIPNAPSPLLVDTLKNISRDGELYGDVTAKGLETYFGINPEGADTAKATELVGKIKAKQKSFGQKETGTFDGVLYDALVKQDEKAIVSLMTDSPVYNQMKKEYDDAAKVLDAYGSGFGNTMKRITQNARNSPDGAAKVYFGGALSEKMPKDLKATITYNSKTGSYEYALGSDTFVNKTRLEKRANIAELRFQIALAKVLKTPKVDGGGKAEVPAVAAAAAVRPGGAGLGETVPQVAHQPVVDVDKNEPYEKLNNDAEKLFDAAQKIQKNDSKYISAWNEYIAAEQKILKATEDKKEAPYYKSLLNIAKAKLRLDKSYDARSDFAATIAALSSKKDDESKKLVTKAAEYLVAIAAAEGAKKK